MKLADAIRRVERDVLPQLSESMDIAAVVSLLNLVKRVQRVREPLRQLERALCPKEELNQVEMFPPLDS